MFKAQIFLNITESTLQSVLITNTFASQIEEVEVNYRDPTCPTLFPIDQIPVKDRRCQRDDFQPKEPGAAHYLSDNRVIFIDKSALVCFNSSKKNGIRQRCAAQISKKYKGRRGPAFFGLFANRRGEIGTYTEDSDKGHLLVWVKSPNRFDFQSGTKMNGIREAVIDFRNWDDSRYSPVIRYRNQACILLPRKCFE